MESLLLPSSIYFTAGDEANTSQLVIEPMFHGYGTTVGNSLRRVMLSSLTGGALTGVRIAGVTHEFTTVEGVKEDAVEITLNLKQMALKVHSETPVRLKLTKKGEGVVKASDFEANADVEIVNPDAVIATITDKGATFEMEAIAEQGRGYLPIEEREKEELEAGWIKLDALFSPVRNVAFKVEPVRIGDITDYDRLVMDIETDGVVTPEEAVDMATAILIEHFELIKKGETTAEAPEPVVEEAEAAEEEAEEETE